MTTIKFQLKQYGFTPSFRQGDNGIDFYCPKKYYIKPGQIIKIPLQIKLKLPKHIFLLFQNKSSVGLKGINSMANVVDSNYRGEIHAVLHNTTKKICLIEPGRKIIQGIILQQPKFRLKQTNFIDEFDSNRGNGAFGSTGAFYGKYYKKNN